MGIIIGLKLNGEQLRFERWVYDLYIRGILRDPFLLARISSCVTFRVPGKSFLPLIPDSK